MCVCVYVCVRVCLCVCVRVCVSTTQLHAYLLLGLLGLILLVPVSTGPMARQSLRRRHRRHRTMSPRATADAGDHDDEPGVDSPLLLTISPNPTDPMHGNTLTPYNTSSTGPGQGQDGSSNRGTKAVIGGAKEAGGVVSDGDLSLSEGVVSVRGSVSGVVRGAGVITARGQAGRTSSAGQAAHTHATQTHAHTTHTYYPQDPSIAATETAKTESFTGTGHAAGHASGAEGGDACTHVSPYRRDSVGAMSDETLLSDNENEAPPFRNLTPGECDAALQTHTLTHTYIYAHTDRHMEACSSGHHALSVRSQVS